MISNKYSDQNLYAKYQFTHFFQKCTEVNSLSKGIPYSSGDYIFQSYEVLYPIPNNEILVNSSLTQNPGYQ
ncbi:MAG: RagB/SusD family nutrient uptake outer membrane protein [Bacteroidetes bacterium]|nr:RagB/SusD family nutrient uptake outer membrane protein [Bacteroidota bacterium]